MYESRVCHVPKFFSQNNNLSDSIIKYGFIIILYLYSVIKIIDKDNVKQM